MQATSTYSPERIGNICQTMPLFASTLRKGDTVMFGHIGDPLYPESYRNSRPSGTVERIVGSEGNCVMAVRMDQAHGGKLAHVDMRTLNPYLLVEPTAPTYQRAVTRTNEPSFKRALAERELNETTFRSSYNAEPSTTTLDIGYRSSLPDANVGTRLTNLEAAVENTRLTTLQTFKGLGEDIARLSNDQPSYAGAMLHNIGVNQPERPAILAPPSPVQQVRDIEFRGVDNDIDEFEVSSAISRIRR